MKPALKRKIKVGIFSVFAVFVVTMILIEGGMRVMGYLTHKRVYLRAEPISEATDFILCTGDSHTYGIGAPEGQSYPSQLEVLLNEKKSQRHFQVVNIGFPGYNSTEAYSDAEKFLATDVRRPSAVIYEAGKNNEHNFTKARFLPEDVSKLGPSAWAKYILANSRAFRFGQITFSRLTQLQSAEDKETVLGFHYNQLLNAEGQEEIAFLKNWIRQDAENMQSLCRKYRIQLILLNYYHPVPWVDDVFSELGQQKGYVFVDVRDFGRRFVKSEILEKNFVSPDLHPNAFGYALIAEMAAQTLREVGVTPVLSL